MTSRRRAATHRAAWYHRQGPPQGGKGRTIRLSPLAILVLNMLHPAEIDHLRRLNGATHHVICK